MRLRYPEEFVRHKMLDIVGDLSLLGKPIRGHLIAIKPSHTANCEFAKLIQAQMNKPLRAAQAFGPPPVAQRDEGKKSALLKQMEQNAELNVEQVMQILPHRYPFLFLDGVSKIDGNKITTFKNVTINEPYFQGHFPGHPIMPGVLQLEAIAQTAGILMLRQAENAGQIAYFMAAENVKWRKPVLPGDILVIEVEMTKTRGKLGKAKGVCKVDDEIVSEAEVTFMLRPE
jgi:UDP-3-O-[3-hydroxymyristoyl] N-acetylglucosamine deacetylase/3-hydroxyacyl-[acyl-carrier-protein] dehydratase